MAHYAYKRACFELIPSAWREPWEQRFLEETGREPDGDAGYDGDYWHMAADYIEHLHAELAKRGATDEPAAPEPPDPNCPYCGHHLVRLAGTSGWFCIKCNAGP